VRKVFLEIMPLPFWTLMMIGRGDVLRKLTEEVVEVANGRSEARGTGGGGRGASIKKRVRRHL